MKRGAQTAPGSLEASLELGSTDCREAQKPRKEKVALTDPSRQTSYEVSEKESTLLKLWSWWETSFTERIPLALRPTTFLLVASFLPELNLTGLFCHPLPDQAFLSFLGALRRLFPGKPSPGFLSFRSPGICHMSFHGCSLSASCRRDISCRRTQTKSSALLHPLSESSGCCGSHEGM